MLGLSALELENLPDLVADQSEGKEKKPTKVPEEFVDKVVGME